MDSMKTLRTFFNPDKVATFVLYFSIFVFIIAFNFSDHGGGGWQLQRLPDLNGSQIIDMTFTDSLTGYAKTNADADSITKLLKTTDGGENWYIIKNEPGTYTNYSFQFLNNNTGFIGINYYGIGSALYKTTTGGLSWDSLNSPVSFWNFEGISALTSEEIWTVNRSPFVGGIFRTTNSGNTWERKFPPFANGDRMKIYMINSQIGFFTDGYNINSTLRKTTDAGLTWPIIPNAHGWHDIYFKDSLNGWKSLGSIKNLSRTTNGGITWDTILTAIGGNPAKGVNNFRVIGSDTIWGAYSGAYILFPNLEYRGVILKTTNSGINWGYQLPDTSTGPIQYNFIDFTDSLKGWSYNFSKKGVHTITGGDSITNPYVGISNFNSLISENYRLFQNYPNPFNPVTIIKYELSKSGLAKIKIFNSMGQEIQILINEKQNTGIYEVKFNGSNLSSGVYFYSLFLDNAKMDTKKMLLIK